MTGATNLLMVIGAREAFVHERGEAKAVSQARGFGARELAPSREASGGLGVADQIRRASPSDGRYCLALIG